MKLTAEEERMLAGAEGPAVQRALRMQVEVGEFFGAEDLVPVSSAHMMAEIESMGEAGLAFVEEMADLGAQVRVPTTCNPRSVDTAMWRQLGQDERQVALEAKLAAALERCGVFVVDTCINYQTFMPPRYGEHLAWGDTGTVIFANSVAGARTNFEGGPVALAAGLTGRTAAYGYHLDEQRRGTAWSRSRIARPRAPTGRPSAARSGGRSPTTGRCRSCGCPTMHRRRASRR